MTAMKQKFVVRGIAEMSSRGFEITVEADTAAEAEEVAYEAVIKLGHNDEAWEEPLTDLAVTEVEVRDVAVEREGP
jgi:hypothetical protein